MWATLLFLLLSLIAEIIGTVGGFGSSVFFVPVAGYFFDFHSVLGITAMFHLSSNISKIALFRHGIDKKLLFSFGIPAVIFVIVGGLLSNVFDNKVLEISLSIFLVVLSLLFLIFRNLELKPTKTNTFLGGSASGFVAGIIGTGGAIRGLTLNAFNLDKNVFIATSAIIDLAVDASRTVVYVSNGYIKSEILYLIPFLFAIGIIGTWIGKRILNKFSQKQFKTATLLLILLVGVLTLIKIISK